MSDDRPTRMTADGLVVPMTDAEIAQRDVDAAASHAVPSSVVGNQWAFALGNLGLAGAWRAGVAKSKDKDQIRWSLVARDTPLLATDPLLIRIAANAGLDGAGKALVDMPTVFAQALTEPT